ncbi:MAG: hypothetical protein IT435_03720 [Phycisphaerales bacterium]|nr:hypothetical protein [Phycisphaerales bacterium]
MPSGETYYTTDLGYSNWFESSGVATTGWTAMTFGLFKEPVQPDPPVQYALHAEIKSQNGSFARQDILVAWDCVLADDELIDLPVRPLLSTSGGVTSLPESITLTYFPFALPAPETWSVFAALRTPETAPDEFTRERAVNPTNLTVLTLWESSAKFLRIVLDRGDPSSPNSASSIKIIDHNGDSVTVEGPIVNEKDGDGAGDPVIPFAQPFFFPRGVQVLLGIARYEISTDVHGHRVWASVGGTRVKAAEFTSGLARGIPRRINSGDPNKVNIDPGDFFGVRVNDANATSRDDGRAMLRTLSFLA